MLSPKPHQSVVFYVGKLETFKQNRVVGFSVCSVYTISFMTKFHTEWYLKMCVSDIKINNYWSRYLGRLNK